MLKGLLGGAKHGGPGLDWRVVGGCATAGCVRGEVLKNGPGRK